MQLVCRHALCMMLGVEVGVSAGANVLASEQWIEKNNPDGIVVTILCDRGERYFSVLGDKNEK